MKAYVPIVLLLTGCSMDAKIEATGIYDCKDLRDGETWSFDSAKIRDVRYGLAGAPSTFKVTDLSGRERLASTEQNAYIKCIKR